MPLPARRFDLTDDEHLRAVAARGIPLRVGDLLRAIRTYPALGPRLLRAAVGGARDGARNDPTLVWAVDIERIRRAVPDAAVGAGWHGLDEFLEVLLPRVPAGARALELGCGGGRVSDRVAPHVAELVATDISEPMLDEARANLVRHRNVTLQLTSGFALDQLLSRHFDIAYAHDVFITLEADAALALLDAAARAVRAEGLVVASFFTIDRAEWRDQHVQRLRRVAATGNFGISNARPYIAAQIDAWFDAAGMTVEWSGYPSGDDAGGQVHYIVVGRVKPIVAASH